MPAKFSIARSMRKLANFPNISVGGGDNLNKNFKINDLLLSWSIPITVLIFWYFLTIGQSSASLFPPPGDVGKATIRLLKDGTLFQNIKISSARAAVGFIIGGLIGFSLGVANGQFRLAEKVLNTPIQMIRNVPHLAALPLILIWFGIGETAKIVLIILGTFFPIYLNTFHGIRYIDNSLIEMGKTYGLTQYQLFKDIIFKKLILGQAIRFPHFN